MSQSASSPPLASQGPLADACGGPGNIHDGCTVHFPRMPPGGSGLCMKCRKLKDPMVSAEEKVRLQSNATVQCDECGICGTTVTNPCGTCRRLILQETNVIDPTLEAAAYQRHSRLQARVNRSPLPPSQAPSCSQQPQFGATTPMFELQALAQAQHIHHVPQPVGQQHVRKVLVHLEIRRSDNPKQTDKALGVSCLPYNETLTMLELQQQLVMEANTRWVDHYPMLLSWQDTSLRVPGNILVPQDSLSLPISEWYRRYSSPELRNTFIVPPRNAAGSGRRARTNTAALVAFSLELFIHVDRFLERLSPDIASQLAAKAGSKRKPSGQQVTSDTPGAKRARSENMPMQSRVLQSRFVPDGDLLTAAPPVVSVHAVEFMRTTCTIEAVTGQPTLHESSTTERGQLAIKPMVFGKADTGRTKEVYSLQIGDSQYAAKKLINIGQGLGVGIDIQKAIRVLSADLVRLKRMEYFARLFTQAASQKSVEIADFEVTDGFILKTYSAADSQASEVSEITTEETPTDGCGSSSLVIPTAVYLVEPFRRNSSVIKYSGTLGASHSHDQRTSTMMAFSHYVAEETACKYVFADIQGSVDVTNLTNIILFDPMTHTPSGSSGLGDHGYVGLQDFIDSHRCTNVCKLLGLSDLSTLQATLDHLQGSKKSKKALQKARRSTPLFTSSSGQSSADKEDDDEY